MRVCHYIKENARSESPTRAIWFQAWTYPKHVTKYETEYDYEFIRMCRGVKDTKTGIWSYEWLTVGTAETFWLHIDTLTNNKTKTWLICGDPTMHLPLIQAFSETCSQNWKLTLAIIPPAPTICRWRKGSKSVVLIGASNIWPTPFVSTSTGKNGCLHLSKSENNEPCVHVKKIDNEISDLRQKTVEWWRFLKQNDLGGFSPTAGSQSFRVWRHRYMTHRVLIDCHDDALALAREAIYGARCEVFERPRTKGPIYELDTNGAYGGIMRDMRVPIKLVSHRYHFTLDDLRAWVQNYVCIARVSINTTENVFPAHIDKKLRFVRGKLEIVLAGEELVYALAKGNVVDAYEVAIYAHAPAFEQYMQALWILRKASESTGTTGDAEKYKLLMASFFGRWAQRGRIWEKVRNADSAKIQSWVDINADTQEITEWRQFGGIVQRLSNESESAESHPAIAACILAAGRMQLWRHMQNVGMEHVYYCDTDALFVDTVGFERLRSDIDAHILGKLKVKGVYSSVTFLAQKHILADGRERLAGVSPLSRHAVDGRTLQVQNQHTSGFLRRGETPRASTKEVTKTLTKKAGLL